MRRLLGVVLFPLPGQPDLYGELQFRFVLAEGILVLRPIGEAH